jgi:hypothetical protein
MTDEAMRQFRVHVRHRETPQAHLVTEASFEAACVAWLERWPGEAGPDPVISIIVRDVATGCEHCFGIDLDSGVTAPCD